MKIIDTFQNRLKKAMEIRNIKQVDLVNKTHLDKTLINKYLSGVIKAKQDKLSILADALNVNEIWLMGYDIPMDKNLNFKNDITSTLSNDVIMSIYGTNSIELLACYAQLNEIGQTKALENIHDLAKIPEYTEKKNALQSNK